MSDSRLFYVLFITFIFPHCEASVLPHSCCHPGQHRPGKSHFVILLVVTPMFYNSVANADPAAATPPPHPVAPANVQSVEDFVPEDSLDHSFLEDPVPQKDKGKPQAKHRVDSER